MAALKEKWTHFLQIAFDPWVLIFFLATLVLVWITPGQKDLTLIAVLSILISISAAIVGGVATKNWLDLTEGTVLVARGKSAIRSLKALLTNIAAFERRIYQHLSRHGEKPLDTDLVRSCFEEFVERCGILEEQAINSIENWTDIIPGAEVKTQIGVITALREEKTKLESEIKEVRVQFDETKEKSATEKDELRKTLREKEKKLSETEIQLLQERRKINVGVLSGLPGLTLSTSLGLPRPLDFSLPGSPFDKTCRTCGQSYTPPSAQSMLLGSLLDDGRCANCKAKGPG